MKHLLACLLALLCAAPAVAAVSVTGSGDTNTRRVVVEWGAGDTTDSAAIQNGCAVWRGSLSGASSGASVYALSDSTAAASSGTLLAAFSSASAAVTSFETSYPFIKVDVTDDPASGKAYLYLYCAREAGGGSAFAGISGSTGNEATLAALYTVDDLLAYPSGGPIYYISNNNATGDYLGTCSDIGPGTSKEAPFCSWLALQNVLKEVGTTVMREGATVSFDCGDSAYTFTTAGELNLVTEEPPTSTDVLLRMEPSRPGCVYTINAASQPATAALHITANPSTGNGAAGGRLVVIGARFTGFTRPAIIVDDGIDFGGVGLSKDSAAATVSADLFRTAADSEGFCLNCYGTSEDEAIISNTEDGRMTLIGEGVFEMAAPGATNSVGVINATTASTWNAAAISRITLIGHTFKIAASNTGTKSVMRYTVGTDGLGARVNGARVLFDGANASTGACILTSDAANREFTFEFYESTFINCDRILDIASSSDTPVPAATTHRIRYSVFQPGQSVGTAGSFAPTFLFNSLNAGSTAAVWDITDNITHLHGGAIANYVTMRRSTAAAGNITANDPAAWRTALAALSGTDPVAVAGYANVFAVNTQNSVDQFDGTAQRCADTLGTGGAACVPATSDAVGGTADGFCDESSTPDLCAKILETSVCDTTAACYTAPNGGAGATYRVELAAPIWGLGTASNLTALNLTARKYGAH
jgi:hypothetical protein